CLSIILSYLHCMFGLPLTRRLPPIATLFPYTTLFRSAGVGHSADQGGVVRTGPGCRTHDPLTASRIFAGRGPVRPVRSDLCRFRSEEHTSELQSRFDLVCRLLLEKRNVAERARKPHDG